MPTDKDCPQCVTTRCCETHCCAWLECDCGDCEMCGGDLAVELSPAELARARKATERTEEIRQKTAEEDKQRAKEDARLAREMAEEAEHQRVLKGMGLKFISHKPASPTTTTTTTTSTSTKQGDSGKDKGKAVDAKPRAVPEDPRIVEARRVTEQARAVVTNVSDVMAKGEDTMASVRDLQQRFERMDTQFKNALGALASALGGGGPIDIPLSADERAAVLPDGVSLKGIAKGIRAGRFQNIVIMAGAGISTSAGIPDFRSPGTGVYANLKQYNLPNPQSMFTLDYFRENPLPFTARAKAMWPGKYSPTPAHLFVRLLQEKGLLLRHYTQNIDCLERKAGVDPAKLVEAHGSFSEVHCINKTCREEMSVEDYRAGIATDTPPRCAKCNELVKPDIVFFGEDLPQRFATLSNMDFAQCDLLIVMGTSLRVQPFAGLVAKPRLTVPRVLLNNEAVAMEIGFKPPRSRQQRSESEGDADAKIRGGFRFGAKENFRDVFVNGPCDFGVQKLVQEVGWEDEFNALLKEFKVAIPGAAGPVKKKGKAKGRGRVSSPSTTTSTRTPTRTPSKAASSRSSERIPLSTRGKGKTKMGSVRSATMVSTSRGLTSSTKSVSRP